MRIDYRNDPEAAQAIVDEFDLVDVNTGEVLTTLPIVYADDGTGVYTMLVRDADGLYQVDPDNYPEILARSVYGPIQFVPKVR